VHGSLSVAGSLPPAASSPSPLSPGSLSPSPTARPALTLLGPIPTAKLGGATAASLQAVLEGAVAEGAPDVIAAVITPDGTWAGAAGIDGPKGRAATARDEFAIASVTKTFTAALVMRLVEQGRMDLDAPLASYLGELKVDTNGATIRQALEMRAGLADDGLGVAEQIVADPGRVWTAAETVAGMDPPFAAAGTEYRYSSPTYRLLAIAAEHVTGKSYAAALRAELLDRVGASRILDQGPEAPTPKPWALPIGTHMGRYRPSDLGVGGAVSCISSATRSTGSSSMASDAPSLAAWVWHLFAGDIVSAPSLQQMLPGDRFGFAYGLDEGPYGVEAVGTSGGKTGYGSQFMLFPESKAVVVIFVNEPDFIIEPIVSGLLEAAVAR
jgi:D-alanyl-D-alanine carboxypeptidase